MPGAIELGSKATAVTKPHRRNALRGAHEGPLQVAANGSRQASESRDIARLGAFRRWIGRSQERLGVARESAFEADIVERRPRAERAYEQNETPDQTPDH